MIFKHERVILELKFLNFLRLVLVSGIVLNNFLRQFKLLLHV